VRLSGKPTHAFTTTSALCAEDFDGTIPLYALPITGQHRQDTQSWTEHYRNHDRLWLSSGPLELSSYRELADPESALATEGRQLCKTIEKATRKPTYYYLVRYYARRLHEAERACPGCGGRWRVRRPNPKATEFARFEFRCRRCRLVSHRGVSTDDQRRARIGEFKGAARP
jgi:predicted  nucleic acid-binding Zn ribbon protein